MALSGAGAAVQMLELHRRELMTWLETEFDALGTKPARVLRSRCCDAPARVIAAELSRDAYTCVVGSRRVLGRRASARLCRNRPTLSLVRL